MTAPKFVLRSYGSTAVVAQLVEEIGASDISFTIAPATGWTQIDGNPLGTAGPFVVVIDRFTPTVELVLCSAINLTTGVVTVFTSSGYSGRGYLGTTAQSHVPGGSGSGVQTCWSAQEAYEANLLVNYVLGGGSGTPSNGQVFTWNTTDGMPRWTNPGAVSGNPAGNAVGTGTTAFVSGTPNTLNLASDFVTGGVTFASNGLTVPATAYYNICANLNWPTFSAGSVLVQTFVMKNGSVLLQSQNPDPAGGYAGGQIAGDKHLTVGDVLTLQGIQFSGSPVTVTGSAAEQWLSVHQVA